VRDTLSRFASAPRRTTSLHETSHSTPAGKSQRHTLDVDSFKRLLLTGESGLPATNTAIPTVPSNPPQLVSDSSSNTDTASLSQPSILESGHQNIEETPRSSYEIDRGDTDIQHDWRSRSGTAHERRPPPPPKPRHGKPISGSTNLPFEQFPAHQSIYHSSPSLEAAEVSQTPSRDATPRPQQDDDTELTATKKRPPPPPLARRKSQNKTATRPGMTRSGSSRYSLNSESDEPASPHPANTSKMAPPPPATRRPHGGRRPSVDLPSTLEEDDTEDDTASIASSRTPSASKRISHSALGAAPPLPPPRKHRGSNRSSIDSQRPSLSALGMTPSGRSSAEYGIPGSVSDSRNVSGNSNATDILADLAALQKEVDNARRSAG
jgi:hypothetical protein